MALDVASMALLVSSVAQAPAVVQCAQSTPESWLKGLLPTIVQTVVSLASITAGVLIAVWSFRKNRQTENEQWIRNQKAAHDQWVRDQKVVEWKDLIELAGEYERLMPAGKPGSSTVNAVRNDILPLCDRIAHSSARALAISPVLSINGIRSMIFQIVQEADNAIGRIDAFSQSTIGEQNRLGTPLDNAMAIRTRFEELHSKLISLARQDLNL